MAKKQKKKPSRTSQPSAPRVKDFLDMTAPAAVKFNTDSYILGSSFRCTLALRSYPTTTEELALLCHLGEKSGVVLHIYIRQATAGEEDTIIHNAQNKNRMDPGSTNNMRRNKEPLVHCTVLTGSAPKTRRACRLSGMRPIPCSHGPNRPGPFFSCRGAAFWPPTRREAMSLPPSSSGSSPLSLWQISSPLTTPVITPPKFYIGKDRFGSNIILDLDRRV